MDRNVDIKTSSQIIMKTGMQTNLALETNKGFSPQTISRCRNASKKPSNVNFLGGGG